MEITLVMDHQCSFTLDECPCRFCVRVHTLNDEYGSMGTREKTIYLENEKIRLTNVARCLVSNYENTHSQNVMLGIIAIHTTLNVVDREIMILDFERISGIISEINEDDHTRERSSEDNCVNHNGRVNHSHHNKRMKR